MGNSGEGQSFGREILPAELVEEVQRETLLLVALYGREWVLEMMYNDPLGLIEMIKDPTLRPMPEGRWSLG